MGDPELLTEDEWRARDDLRKYWHAFCDADAAVAVEAYGRLIQGGTQSFEMGPNKLQFAKNCHPNTLHWAYADFVREHIHELRGKNLACWCKQGEPCHADVLLEIANAEDSR